MTEWGQFVTTLYWPVLLIILKCIALAYKKKGGGGKEKHAEMYCVKLIPQQIYACQKIRNRVEKHRKRNGFLACE